MNDIDTIAHTKWDCKYHVVFIPKCRRKALFAQLRKHLGDVFRTLTEQKESKIVEGHLMPDHVHMLISIPPKYSVAQIIGYIKGKSAIHIARVYIGQRKNFTGQHFWARVLRVDGRCGRGADQVLHPAPGGRGQADRADAAVLIERPPSGGAHIQAARERLMNRPL